MRTVLSRLRFFHFYENQPCKKEEDLRHSVKKHIVIHRQIERDFKEKFKCKMLEWEFVSIEISLTAFILPVLKCVYNLIPLSILENSGFNQIYEMKLVAFTNG